MSAASAGMRLSIPHTFGIFITPEGRVVGQFERHIPPAAKAAIDFAAVAARLKPCPFKTNSN
jgi:hypothetical protein